MKKTHLIIAALAAITLAGTVPAQAATANIPQLTSAILNNNYRQVRRHIKATHSKQTLTDLLKMAQEKNAFYHGRLKRWQRGEKLALAGVPVGTILAAVAGLGVGTQKGKSPRAGGYGADVGPMLGAAVGAGVGATAGMGATTSIVAWTQKNIKKWEKQANESERIVDLIQDKIETMQ